MSDHGTLRRLAAEVGVPEAEVVDVLATGQYADAVRADEQLAASLGASAVPFFVVDRALGATGAHPPEAMLQLLQQGWAAKPRLATVTGGEACGPDGC